MSRKTHHAMALMLLGILGTGCSHDRAAPTATQGVVWTRITPSAVAEPDRPDWRGDSIAFEAQILGKAALAVANEDGSGISYPPRTGTEEARAPRWVEAGVLVYASNLAGPQDIWYQDLVSGLSRRLTDFPPGTWTPVPRPSAPGLAYVYGAAPEDGRLFLLPDTAAAPLATVPLTPSTFAASEPDWSPAGDQLCFSSPGPNGTRQIWRLSLSDTLPVQLTVPYPPTSLGPVIDRSPRWSPDGTKILFASNRGGRWGVWTLSPQGEAQGLEVLTLDMGGAEVRHPAWSPDGTRVILSSNRSGERALWVLSNLP